MDAPELTRRLKPLRGDAQAIAALVAEASRGDDGSFDPLAFCVVLDAAKEAGQDGRVDQAVQLCVEALPVAGSELEALEEDDSDFGFLRCENLRWTRWELRQMLRQYTRRAKPDLLAICERLAPRERQWLAKPVLAADDIVRAADDPDALAELMLEATTALDEETQLDALVALREAAAALSELKRYASAFRLCRDAVEQLFEGTELRSQQAEAAFRPQLHALMKVAGQCLSQAVDEEWARDGIAWLAEPTSDNEPRLAALGLPIATLGEDLRRALMALLEKRAEKHDAFAHAMAQAAKGVLDEEAYLALCRRVGYLHEVVAVLLARDDTDGALAEARDAIAGSEHHWTLAKQFVEHERLDLAEQLLTEVARDTVKSEIEFYFANLLRAQGRDAEALAVHRHRFDKRPALPQYLALREMASEQAWPALRAELIEALRGRRLMRPLIDVAVEERDWQLADEVFPTLRDEDAAYAEQRLAPFVAEADGVDAATLRSRIEDSRARRSRRAPPSLAPVSTAKVPTRVRHKKFGEGKVVGHSGSDAALKLEVEFEGDAGRKVLLARFVEPLDEG